MNLSDISNYPSIISKPIKWGASNSTSSLVNSDILYLYFSSFTMQASLVASSGTGSANFNIEVTNDIATANGTNNLWNIAASISIACGTTPVSEMLSTGGKFLAVRIVPTFISGSVSLSANVVI